MGSLTEVLIVVGLTLLAGIFVAAEIALVSLRRSRVDQLVDENRRGAARVRRLIDDPARFLAVIQIAITFIGFLVVGRRRGRPDRAGWPTSSAASSRWRGAPTAIALVDRDRPPRRSSRSSSASSSPRRSPWPTRIARRSCLAGPVDLLGRLLGPRGRASSPG